MPRRLRINVQLQGWDRVGAVEAHLVHPKNADGQYDAMLCENAQLPDWALVEEVAEQEGEEGLNRLMHAVCQSQTYR